MSSEHPRLLLVLSDIHCGSVVGLMPPDTETGDGNKIGFGKNLHHAWLWSKWLEMQTRFAKIRGKSPYAMLLNGDLTEGVHHSSIENLTQVIEDHANMAVECLQPLASKASQVLITQGTECHTHNIESYIAKRLKARSGKALPQWLFRIAGTLVSATHHISTAGRAVSESSALGAELGNARLQSARAGHEIPTVFLRGHRHVGGWYSDGAGLMGVTGGWQFLTRYGRKVVPSSVPRPSALVLDWRSVTDGSLPVVNEISFPSPQGDIDVL